jgi:hypothetical protein
MAVKDQAKLRNVRNHAGEHNFVLEPRCLRTQSCMYVYICMYVCMYVSSDSVKIQNVLFCAIRVLCWGNCVYRRPEDPDVRSLPAPDSPTGESGAGSTTRRRHRSRLRLRARLIPRTHCCLLSNA